MHWPFDRIIAFIFLLASIFGIVEPIISTNASFSETFRGLFDPSFAPRFVMQWLIVLAFFAMLYVVILQFIYRNKPITIISTKLVATFDKEGNAVLTKLQLLRANQPNVTAYLSRHTATTNQGSVDINSIQAHAFCKNWYCKDQKEIRLTGKTVELLHIFDRPMPFAWYMPLIPIWIMNRDPDSLVSFLQTKIVKRNDSVKYNQEFLEPSPMMNFTQAGRYQHFNLCIELNFENTNFRNFKARELRDNGVVDLQYEEEQIFIKRIRVDKMTTGTIRLTWDQ